MGEKMTQSKEEQKGGELDNLKWELFCQEYVKPGEDFLKAGRAYAKVYNFDYTDPKQRNTCDVSACDLLRNPKIHDRIMQFMYAAGCNEENAVQAIKEVMEQKEDKGSRLKATDLYYKYIKGVADKVEITGEVKGVTITVKNFKKEKENEE